MRATEARDIGGCILLNAAVNLKILNLNCENLDGQAGCSGILSCIRSYCRRPLPVPSYSISQAHSKYRACSTNRMPSSTALLLPVPLSFVASPITTVEAVIECFTPAPPSQRPLLPTNFFACNNANDKINARDAQTQPIHFHRNLGNRFKIPNSFTSNSCVI